MTYQVTHTDSTNPLKPPYTVKDGMLNSQTDLQFVGRGYTGFAPIIANDMLHMLENFAAGTPPPNPVQGQLWYDTLDSFLKIYDGTSWAEAGSIKKSQTNPGTANSIPGDLWVNTQTSQLYLFSGSSWLLVGPSFSEGLKTGPVVEVYVDTSNVSHSVISFYGASVDDSNDHILSIISKDTFIPKTPIIGFATIFEGVNLSTVNSTAAVNPTRFNGTATSADALLINNSAVTSNNFLRNDVANGTNFPFAVAHDGGISLGKNGGFNIAVGTASTQFFSNNSNNSVDFLLTSGGTQKTVLHIDSGVKVGIGNNNTTPLSTLDVAGVITASGITSGLVVQGTADSTSVTAGSIVTAGGLSVGKGSTFGGNITSYGKITFNNLDSSDVPIATAVILPGVANTYDIGSTGQPFRNIYAQTFNGTFNGSFSGVLRGTVTGTAAALATPTTFSLTGDVTSNAISFNGQTEHGSAVFTTVINDNIISTKPPASDSNLSDYLLIYRQGSGLLKMSKKTLLNHVPTIPVGTIMPYAGSALPATGGYMFCDGTELQIAQYPDLYAVIGYSYKASSQLKGLSTFALPDLRGRFPLGRDDMNNHITVPSKDGSGTLVTTGGGAVGRVSGSTSTTLGAGAGSESVTVSSATVNTSTGTNTKALSSNAFNVMNPYQTINYIIFTGVI